MGQPMALRDFQAQFGRSILEPAQSVPATLGIAEQSLWRFDIYRNNYFHGLLEQLSQAYPMVAQLLGGKAFSALARQYLERYPPQSVSLALLGEDFVSYLDSLVFSANGELICSAARLDRACLEALHAADASTLPIESLQGLAEDLAGARFVWHPAARLVASTQPLVTNWEASQQGRDIVAGPGEGALVTRAQGGVRVRSLGLAGIQFGQSLMNSMTVMEAYDRALAIDESFDLTQCFSDFLSAGAFSAVQVNR